MKFAGLTAGHEFPFGVLNALIIRSNFPSSVFVAAPVYACLLRSAWHLMFLIPGRWWIRITVALVTWGVSTVLSANERAWRSGSGPRALESRDPGPAWPHPTWLWDQGQPAASAVLGNTDTHLVKSGRRLSAWSSLYVRDCLLDIISDWLFLWSQLTFIKTLTFLCPCNTSVPFQIYWKVSFTQNYIPQRSSVSGGGSCPQSCGH